MRVVVARPRSAVLLAAVALVAAASLVGPSRASAATCWQRVVDDWRDGHITGTYTAACLRSALRHLPEDLRVYGSAEEDITRALTRSVDPSSHKVLAATATRTKPAVGVSKSTPARKATRSLSGRTAPKPKAPAVAMAASAKDSGGTPLAPARTAVAAAVLGLVALALAIAVWRRRRRAAHTL